MQGRAYFLSISLVLMLALCNTASVDAREIADVDLPESISLTGSTTPLLLNGAGIRSKFIFDIYVGALYLPSRQTRTEAILAQDVPNRVLLHFLYHEVEREKLIESWNEGFGNNLSATEFAEMQPRLTQFNGLFETVHKGDTLAFDYRPGQGTLVSLNHQSRGTIVGRDFNVALLKVWLGEHPAHEGLKAGLLGQNP